MPKKLTQEEFLAKAVAVHGVGRYDYSRVVYVDVRTRVDIICPRHGIFQQMPQGHLKGAGCTLCYKERKGASVTKTSAHFIAKSIMRHGNKYDYSLVEYKSSKEKVSIICPVHGVFEQVANVHTAGKGGCTLCGLLNRPKRDDKQSFVQKAIKMHSNAYDYSQVTYRTSRIQVEIICPAHGVFKQKPTIHLRGHGCQSCAFECSAAVSKQEWTSKGSGIAATLYLIKLTNANETFYKIGVTYKLLNYRFYKSNLAGYSYEVVALYKSSNAGAVYDWEQSILASFSHLRYTPIRQFIGSTECFSGCDEILAIFPIAG